MELPLADFDEEFLSGEDVFLEHSEELPLFVPPELQQTVENEKEPDVEYGLLVIGTKKRPRSTSTSNDKSAELDRRDRQGPLLGKVEFSKLLKRAAFGVLDEEGSPYQAFFNLVFEPEILFERFGNSQEDMNIDYGKSIRSILATKK